MTHRQAKSLPRLLSKQVNFRTLCVALCLVGLRSESKASGLAQETPTLSNRLILTSAVPGLPETAPPVAEVIIKTEIREEDLLLMSVDLDGLTVTDALPAYGSADDPLLPLGTLARLLDLDITVSTSEQTVIGRIGQAQRAVTIDLTKPVARLNGQELYLKAIDFAATNADLYFRASVLERILRIKIRVDIEALQLKISSDEKLPVQARLERLAQLSALRPEDQSVSAALHVDSPYKLWSPPAFDVSLQAGVNALPPRSPRGYDIRIGSDLLYAGFQGFLSSDQNGKPVSARATLERHNIKGGLLGPINATSFAVGDIFTPALVMGPRGSGGRGFVFSNAPLLQTSVFSRIDLRGDLPIGYDVQLFINDILRSGQRTPVQGRYEFLNVPLQRGLNVIRTVLNGPTGQRTEQTRIVNVGGGQLKPGTFTYSVGAAQQDTPLIAVQRQIEGLGLSPGQGHIRASANVAYGLSENVTLVGGTAFYSPTNNAGRALFTGGARASLFGAAVQLDAAGDDKGGTGLGLGLSAQRFGISVLFRHSEYRGSFIDESIATGTDTRQLARHSQINLDFNAKLSKSFLMPISFGASRDIFVNGSSNLMATLRTSTTIRNFLLGSGVDFQSSATPASLPGALSGASTRASTHSLMSGNFSVSTFYDLKWQLRANIDYILLPRPNLGNISLTADRELNRTMSLRLGLGRSFVGEQNTVQIGFIKRTRYGDLALTGNYTYPSKAFQIGATFSFGIAFDPLRHRYVLTRAGPGTGGSVAFQAFTDTDGDGAYGPNDRPVANVSLEGGQRPGFTDKEGRAFVSGFGSAPTGQIQVGLDDIDDPYVHSPPRTVIFTPRAGLVVKVPFPLTASSEIMAHVVLRQADQLVGISAVRVRLVPERGSALEASTEFDGSVGFEQVGAGTYNFELDPEQAKRLHMRLKAPVKLIVPATGGTLPDLTAEVEFDRPS